MTSCRTALLVWEYGKGLGHIAKLRFIADRLKRHGYRTVLVNPTGVPHHMCHGFDTVAECPQPYQLIDRDQHTKSSIVSFNSSVEGFGFSEANYVFTRLTLWKRIFAEWRPDLLVADYAPCALLAAKGDIPTLAIGNGYTLPPDHLETYPVFDAYARHSDKVDPLPMLNAVNAALQLANRPRIDYLPQIFAADISACMTFPFTDPYAAIRLKSALGPEASRPIPLAEQKAEPAIFCYLTHCSPRVHRLALLGLIRSGIPARVYSLQADSGDRASIQGTRVEILEKPMPLDEILGYASLVVHLGGHQLCMEMIMAGMPQLVLTTDVEKILHARLMSKYGLARYYRIDARNSPEEVTQSITDAVADESIGSKARGYAARLPDNIHEQSLDWVERKVLALV